MYIIIVPAILISLISHATGAASLVKGCESGGLISAEKEIVCSATWQFNGKCEGADMWDKWTVTGRTSPQDSFIRPWASTRITVIGYEIVKLEYSNDERNDKQSWFMIGSGLNAQPDAMLWLAPGETHSKQFWPHGMGHAWPNKHEAQKGKLTDIIDLHGLCFGGGDVTIFITIYYTPFLSSQDNGE